MNITRTTLRLSARNAMRRRSRTLLTAAMVVVGTALLLLASSWISGIMGQAMSMAASVSGHVRVVTPQYAEREDLNPLEENFHASFELVSSIAALPLARGIEPRILTGVTLTVGEEIGEVFAPLLGARESYFREYLDAKSKLARGAWFSGEPDEVIMGATAAKDVGASIGDELVMLGVTQDGSLSPIKCTVVGIVSMGSSLDQQVFVPLEKAQWLADVDGATELLIFGHDHTNADALAAQVRSLPLVADLLVESWSEREPMKSMAVQISSVQSIIVTVLVLLVSLGIWNTMMMSVLERTYEIGVMRAMGLSRLGAVGLFFGEALTIGVLGGLLGVALGAYPAWLLEKHGVQIGEKTVASMDIPMATTMHGELSLHNVVFVFFVGVLMAVIGSLLPAIRAASIQPITAMRHGR